MALRSFRNLSILLLIFFLSCLMVRGERDFELLKRSKQKFMFKHSFKPPMIVNAKGQIPFWDHGGDALPTDEQVRVCPSIQDRKGWAWNKYMFEGQHWTIDTTFSIAGRNTYGADGMVFWFTTERYVDGGNMFGSSPAFHGMGIVIDTFDNDQQGDSPKVSLYVSNKTLDYNHGTDGSNQELSFCLRQVRNQRYPTKMKVFYVKKTLEVWFQDASDNKSDHYNLCLRNEGVYLPATGYFGISAATGGLSDDHDVMSFVVHSITIQEQERMEEIDKTHAERLQQYVKFSEDFEGKRQDTLPTRTQEDWQIRLNLEENVRMIYDLQSGASRDLKILISKVNDLSLVRSTSTGGAANIGITDDKMTALEGRLSHHINELKTHITSGGGGGGLTASEQLQPFYELRESIKDLKKTIETAQENIQQEIRSSPCPEVAPQSCLSAGLFIFIILIQSATFIAFFVIKYNQESRAKKFF
ncbi:PREDICTED: protein ERGIC-53-like [Amphimedon queenslandica]|uniref:L-type lectin-like domain-containing protein n=1 Tax=Amphimedon queenslandica TaxID=400682 RepID=A0A1X7VUI3_AMPQE|nr:PREDICTED: protein ERGIC-53-like [Amphimedon queenslandica]|eukprot:XP_011405140.1 PREDICTED: protein ERGIC-53-like [Amphimedon queenslandica]